MCAFIMIYIVCVLYLMIQMDNSERLDYKGLEETKEALGLAFATMLLIAIIYVIIY